MGPPALAADFRREVQSSIPEPPRAPRNRLQRGFLARGSMPCRARPGAGLRAAAIRVMPCLKATLLSHEPGALPAQISQTHGMVWAGRDLIAHLVPNPAMGRDISLQPRVLQAPSSLALDTASTASLGNLCQGFTTHRANFPPFCQKRSSSVIRQGPSLPAGKAR